MKQTITELQFRDAFQCVRPDNFSHEGLGALWEYLTNYEEELGEEIELDVIAFCCEYSEYKNIQEFQSDYDDSYESIDDIENETIVIKIDDDSFIIQQF